ncbi:hypothetical protein NliqN6_4296 [Naganishia liquefaciens]|uniref:Cytochrome P450 n=1 Tax=Naganishia liquefaciens TaxID=104408 RepID=A0A8H3YFQ8_9TREE|nr:hypothetical protein NliqN6_4296 [Naganishia liquefaciens]
MHSPSHISIGIAILGVVVSIFLYTYWNRRCTRAKYARLPPGPKSHWLLGTKLPKKYPWRYFEDLTRQYGDHGGEGCVTIWQGQTPLVIVGRVAAAQELLEKNAAATADRPRSIAGNIMSGGMRILLVGYGDRWRKLRKALHSHLQPQSAKTYEAIQERAAKRVLSDIISAPQGHQEHIKTYAATVVLNIAYGRTEKVSYSDPDIQLVNRCGDRLGQTLRPGSFKVESLPWLRYVPNYTKTIDQWHADELALFRGQLDSARQRLKESSISCFTRFISEKQQEYRLSDNECAYLCGSLFGAGSDTSASAISIVIMAAAVFPEAQRRVQEELDRVVGRDRLPSFDDQDDLPVTWAFIRESYRWRPVSSGGFQHKTTEDIDWKGFFIPAGTPILGNHWGIHRDPTYYPDPETFNIDRWLVKDEEKNFTLDRNMKHFQFGFGRRVCPGQHIADRSVFINTSSLLWAFRVSQEEGKPIDTLAFTNAANSHPLPYTATFTRRFDAVEEILNVEQTAAEM